MQNNKRMFAKSVLVTGCNRGIGLEFVKQLANKTQHLFAACRIPDKAEELQSIANVHKNITVLKLDVMQQNDIDSMMTTISKTVGGNGLNCLINNAGVINRDNVMTVTKDTLEYIYTVNCIGTAMLSKSSLPLLSQASSLTRGSKMSVSRASILNISSVAGSIENAKGTDYAYRMSKAALNMLTVNMSVELKREKVLAVTFHPGRVKTDMMIGATELIELEESVEGMINAASKFVAKDSGLFFDWNGEKMAW